MRKEAITKKNGKPYEKGGKGLKRLRGLEKPYSSHDCATSCCRSLANSLPFLCLSFLSKIGIILIPTSQVCREDSVR